MAKQRLQGDEAIDNIIRNILITGGREALTPIMDWCKNTRNFDEAKVPPQFQEIYRAYSQLPQFADWQKMEEGFKFFKKFVAPIAMMLGCYSLPYCYMGADGAQVLYISEKIHQNTTQRLNDTGDFIREMHNPKKWRKAEPFVRAFKVRLMHGIIRGYLAGSPKWDMAWGLALNQEDKAGTNLAFSYIVMKGLEKLGYKFSNAEAEAYLHTWKVIGYLMGVHRSLLVDTWAEASHLDALIVERNFRESEVGKYLTASLIASSRSVIKIPILRDVPTAIMREMLGNDYADKLNIPTLPYQQKIIKYLPFKLLVRNSRVIRE